MELMKANNSGMWKPRQAEIRMEGRSELAARPNAVEPECSKLQASPKLVGCSVRSAEPSLLPAADRLRSAICCLTVSQRRPRGLYLLRNHSKMPPTRPPVSNAFFCFSSRLS